MVSDIKSIFSKNLVSIKETASLSEADDMMNNYNIRHLPVTDKSDTLVGILAKSDYIALKHVDSRLNKFVVKNFMSSQVKVVSKFTKIREVAKLFVSKKISSVLVVDDTDVVGIVTSEDLIKLLANYDYSDRAEELDLSALAEEGWISQTTAQ